MKKKSSQVITYDNRKANMNLNLNYEFEQEKSRSDSRGNSRVNSRYSSPSLKTGQTVIDVYEDKQIFIEEDQDRRFREIEEEQEDRENEFQIRNLLSKPSSATMFLKIQNEESAKQASEQNLVQQRNLEEINRIEESLKELKKDFYKKDSSSN